MKLRQATADILVISRRRVAPVGRWLAANLMDLLFVGGLVVMVVTSFVVNQIFGGYVLAAALLGYALFLLWTRR